MSLRAPLGRSNRRRRDCRVAEFIRLGRTPRNDKVILHDFLRDLFFLKSLKLYINFTIVLYNKEGFKVLPK